MVATKPPLPIETCLQGPLSRQVKLLIQAKQFDQARETCQSALVSSPLDSPARIPSRFEAIGNLFLVAINTDNNFSLDWTLGTLKSEVDQIFNKFLSSNETAEFSRNLVVLSESMGSRRMWPAAKSVARLALRLMVKDTPENFGFRLRALNNLGSALLAENRIDDATHVWQCAIKDYDPKAVDQAGAALSTLHNNLAELRRLQCKMKIAQTHHARALELRVERFSEADPLVRQSRFNLAQVLIECLKYEEALEVIQTYLKSFDESQQKIIDYYRGKVLEARILMEMRKFRSAEAIVNSLARTSSRSEINWGRHEIELHLLRLELAIALGKENVMSSEVARMPELIKQQNLTGSIYEGKFVALAGQIPAQVDITPLVADRETHLQSALQILRRRLVRSHPLLVDTIFELSELFAQTSRGQRGIQTAKNAVTMIEQSFDDRSLPYASALVRLASVLLDQRQYPLVKRIMRQVIGILREHDNPPAGIRFDVYDILSRAYEGLEKQKLASYFASAVVKVSANELELLPTSEDLLVDRALDLAARAGHPERAIALQQRRIEIISDEYHADHPAVAEATERLGRMLAEHEDYEDAADRLLSVLTVRCTDLGEESPLALELMQLTADCCEKAGLESEAAEIQSKIQLLSDKASHVLSDLL